MNRPSSAFGLLLGFLALTMFAVSSTSRSTTVKPTAGYADRAAIRRQAALSRLSALAAAAESTTADDLLADEALCVPDSFDSANSGPAVADTDDGQQPLQQLGGSATVQLASVQLEPLRDDLVSLAAEQMDGRTHYDAAYDRAVLGITEAKLLSATANDQQETRELSAVDIANVFHSVMQEKSTGSRNAKGKMQRRASLDRPRLLVDSASPTL